MADWNAISAFMANVVAWPGDPKDPGYVNLHFSTVDRKNPSGPLRKGSGWPFRSVDALVGRASWLNTTTQFKDAWYCLSLQSQTKPNVKDPTKPKAHRLAANALKLKALWIDMDVGLGDPKKYPSIEEALKAVILFREKATLPPFSAIVGSGSGIHVYWISDVALTRAEWEPYAGGLKALILQAGMKCDAGLTTDAARILRVPGTFNHKTNPPKPVQLFNVPLVMYNFGTQLSFLKSFAAPTPTGVSTPAHTLFADGADLNSFQRPPAIKITGEPDLNAGIEKYDESLLDIKPIFAQCGFYKEALRTGGKNYDNALWMYSVLGATFMENGNAVAHAISQGHETYSEADTQALYDRKVAERADRGIGYPSCATIQGAGCQACATCPLLAKGKSPLNIRPAVTATVTALNMAAPSQQTQTAKDLSLPEGYDVDANGYICEVLEQEVGGELMPPMLYQLFLCKITDPWVQSNPDSLNFTVTIDKGSTHQASIRMEDMAGMGLDRVMLKAKIKIFPRNKARLEHFIVAWLAKLHEMAAAQAALPFGWYKDGVNLRGFVFAGKLMLDDGGEQPCGVGDARLRTIFHPTGDIQHWYTACRTITQQKRPELDAIIALSFAAPLTGLVGKNAMTLCAYGESGVGKTAAYSVGVSVWGHSKKGKAVSHSTFNGVMRKMGELSNLPLYWDEIKDPKAQAAVYDFIYNASDGVEKDRATANLSMAERGTWQTQMMAAANISLIDYVMKKDPSHVAGVSRILEYNVKKVTKGPGRISQTDADVIFDKLMTSYGQIGLLYAKLLAMNHVAIKQECVDTCKQVERDMQNSDEERLWVAQVGTLLVGARLANTLGCDFDVEALKVFLYRVYKDNRDRRNNMMAVSGQRNTTEAVMTGYFAQVQANDQGIWTVGMPTGVGKTVNLVLHGPKDTKNVAVTTNVAVRWDTQNRKLYILKTHLVDYLTEANLGVSTSLESLRKDYNMTYQPRTRIAGGTTYDCGRDTCLVFEDIGPDHDWAEIMYKYTPDADRPKRDEKAAPAAGARVDTGFGEFTPAGLTPTADVTSFVQGATRG